jgi:hypothetical protein
MMTAPTQQMQRKMACLKRKRGWFLFPIITKKGLSMHIKQIFVKVKVAFFPDVN